MDLETWDEDIQVDALDNVKTSDFPVEVTHSSLLKADATPTPLLEGKAEGLCPSKIT